MAMAVWIERGRDGMGNGTAECRTGSSTIGGSWTNQSVRSWFPQYQRIPERGRLSRGEGGGFPMLKVTQRYASKVLAPISSRDRERTLRRHERSL